MRAAIPRLATAVLACSALLAAAPSGGHQGTAAVDWRVIVDDLHLDFTDTGRVRAMLVAVVDEALAHGERVMLRSTGPSAVDVAPTTDANLLRLAARSVTGNGLKDVDLARALGDRTGGSDSEPTRRALTTLDIVQSVVEGAAGGTSQVIVITNGLPGSDATLSAALGVVTTTARRGDVRILAADPRDPVRLVPPPPPDLAVALVNLRASEAASLDRLATSTGGAVAHGLGETLAAMVALRR